MVSHVTLIGLVFHLATIPSGVDLTIYSVIGDQPSTAGGVNDTSTSLLPGCATTSFGASGAVSIISGVTSFDAILAVSPSAFFAMIVNVYGVPFCNCIMVTGLSPHRRVTFPGCMLMKYWIGNHPVSTGGINSIVASLSPATAITFVGAPGTVGGSAGTTSFDGSLTIPYP